MHPITNSARPMALKTITTINPFSILKPTVPTREQAIVNQIKRCSNLKELEHIYAAMIKSNAVQDCFLANQFVSACTSFHRMDYAVLAFTQMLEPNAFVYNALIKCFVSCDYPIRALECYKHMLRAMVSPTSFTYTVLAKACGLISALRFGGGVHGHILKLGFGSNTFVQTVFVDFYSNMGKTDEARKVFNEMPERDVYAWTTMVAALVRAVDLSNARILFDEMPERNTATWNTMIDGYARVKDVESAESLFSRMPAKDIISWTTMINCYSQNKQFMEALDVFYQMRANGVSPDEVTMSAIISACAHLGALDVGREIHLYVMQNRFNLDVYVGSALVDMYAKCGSLERSLLVFFKLREKNLFCWNSIIEGLARHGFPEEALAMFSRMEAEDIKPNEVTFISVLGACTHAGLVEEGRQRFLSMTRDYLISPDIGHYGCMVDLFSRAGLLEEALGLIRSMKLEPNAVIWCSLLGGCKVHKNWEIAEVALKQLVVLEPNNSGHYALLVNLYAESNRWSEVAKIRERMVELRVEKISPASSWISRE